MYSTVYNTFTIHMFRCSKFYSIIALLRITAIRKGLLSLDGLKVSPLVGISAWVRFLSNSWISLLHTCFGKTRAMFNANDNRLFTSDIYMWRDKVYDSSNINSHICVSEWLITKVWLVNEGGRRWNNTIVINHSDTHV